MLSLEWAHGYCCPSAPVSAKRRHDFSVSGCGRCLRGIAFSSCNAKARLLVGKAHSITREQVTHGLKFTFSWGVCLCMGWCAVVEAFPPGVREKRDGLSHYCKAGPLRTRNAYFPIFKQNVRTPGRALFPLRGASILGSAGALRSANLTVLRYLSTDSPGQLFDS